MTESTDQFLGSRSFTVSSQQVSATCPSNIALIKYWGKYPGQLPANPSISYTLDKCRTNTVIEFNPNEKFHVETYLAGHQEVKFAEKIEKYFEKIENYLPWILQGSFIIRTENTFPHSSGIASSASGFGAIAKCLMQLDALFSVETDKNSALQKASFLARLGSGSACRSLYDGLVVWGDTEIVDGSSDLFAVPYPEEQVHDVFKNFNDCVLLVHEGSKTVSSTVGHALMNDHRYAETRFQEAREAFPQLKEILKGGNLKDFIALVEHEALTLHAMMMMSSPAFILMKPETVQIIDKIWKFRQETQLPLFFTLDAGANVHVLFPGSDIDIAGNKVADGEEKMMRYIEDELLSHTQNGNVVKDKIRF